MGCICSKNLYDDKVGKYKPKTMKTSMADNLTENDKKYFIDLKKRRTSTIQGLDLTGLKVDSDEDSN